MRLFFGVLESIPFIICHAGKEGFRMNEEQNRKKSSTEDKREDKKEDSTAAQGMDNRHYRDSSGKTIFEDPILFYDGVENWTAATSLHERVLLSDILGKYIPNYQCILVQLKEYSNEELIRKKDELSVLMMIDKLRNFEDYEKFREEIDETFLKETIGGSPEYLLKLMSQIVRMFLAKLNVPREEAEAFTEQIKERKMGELFKHFEGWDVQAIRKEAKEEAEKEAEKAVEKAVEKATEESIRKFLNVNKKFHASREDAQRDLMEEYGLSREGAEEKMARYW